MRSADRTLLSSLGFDDRDKSNHLHDWACQYVAIPDITFKVAGLVFPDREFVICEPGFEKLMTKGEGQYATTIGFADVCFLLEFPDSKVRRDSYGGLCVEVKIDPVSVGEVIRQINLYKKYHHSLFNGFRAYPIRWVLATYFIYDEYDMAALRGSGIHPVYLGQAFDDWCEKRRSGPAVLPSGQPGV